VVKVVERERRIERLVECCRAGLDLTRLRDEILSGLRSLILIDAAFLATVDPQTLLFTSVIAEEPLGAATALFLDNEYGRDDVNKFSTLAMASDHVRSLDAATAGDRRASDRYVDVMAPLELGDELRAALVTAGRCWGVLCLHRHDSQGGFTPGEVALVRRLAPHIAEGLRRALVVGGLAPAAAGVRGPGLIVLDRDMVISSTNAEAEQWMAELYDPAWIDVGTGLLPAAVFAAAAALDRPGAQDPGRAAVRLRSVDGGWLTLHASRLTGPAGSRTAIVIEPARPSEVASVHLAAIGLTPAQSRVASLVLQGRSTRQIVTELHISADTVQEHLRSAFEKAGVASRRELVATLLGTHR
jgi:DNA-binding CsgD family transcriptional regulator